MTSNDAFSLIDSVIPSLTAMKYGARDCWQNDSRFETMTRPEPKDEDLLARIAQGDRSAMRVLYEKIAPVAQRFAMNYVSDAVEVADIVQNAMLDVWQTAHRFDNRSSARTWILSITRNKAIDHIRKTHRTVLAEPDEYIPDDTPSPEAILSAAQEGDRIRACISTLSESHRAAIHLAFFEELSYREIAVIENVPESTIKTRIYHAKKLLLRCVTAK